MSVSSFDSPSRLLVGPLVVLNPEDVAEGGPVVTEMLRQHKASHGPQSHLAAPYHILYGYSLVKYNKLRLNDSTAHGYTRPAAMRSAGG